MKTFPLLLLFTITFCCLISCGDKNPPPPNPTGDTQKPTCSISVTSVTTNSATFSFSASDNVGVTNLTLSVVGTTDVTGQSTLTVTGLTPNTGYTAILTARDAAGNAGTASASFTTNALPPQNSTWFAQPSITYSSPVSGMIGNTVSNEFNIVFSNTSAVSKTATFNVNFGANGSAVKMLRYQMANAADGTGWTVIPASAGTVTFSNYTLQPGTTTLRARFALKENVGVTNESSLSISFSFLNDGEGGVLPIGGGYQPAVNAGTVDAATQATKLTTEWLGYMRQTPLSLDPSGVGSAMNYGVGNVKVSGPGNARVASMKLRNPYGNLIVWDNGSWKLNFGAGWIHVVENWNGEFVKINAPLEAVISNTNFTSFSLWCDVRNPSSTTSFNSGTITPGLYGLELKSKYDLEILNSNGQVIDLSDVVVKQGASTVTN